MLPIMLCLAISAETAPPPKQYNDPMQKYSAGIEAAESIGASIFDFDMAASVATDEVLLQTKGMARNELTGWICEQSDKGITVSFLVHNSNNEPGIKYSVLTSNGRVVPKSFRVNQSIMPLSKRQMGQYQARQRALESIPQPCSRAYNPVVLHDSSANRDIFRVYTIPSTDKPNVILAGGFFRFDISPDGSRILSQRGFTKSCLELPTKQSNATGVFTSHLLDEIPTEVHVYLNLMNRIPVYVSTTDNNYIWAVENGKIKFIEEMNNQQR